MSDMLIIEAALNEAVPKENNPNVPYGPEEVAAETAACVEAGLSLLHFHARDTETGSHSWTDAAPYRQTIQAMREQGVPVALPWYPTYAALDRPSLAHVAALAADPQAGLAMASIEIGTTNLNDFDPKAKRFVNPDSVWTLSHAGAKDMFDFCREFGLRPYLGVYEPGHLRHIAAYLDKGWLEPPLVIKLAFSDFAPFGLPPAAECVGMYAEMIDMVLPGVAAEWFVSCAGPSIWDLVPAAIDAGGHVRIGLGQYHPWSWLEPTNDHPTNAEQVARVAGLAKSSGRKPATPAEARAMMGLEPA